MLPVTIIKYIYMSLIHDGPLLVQLLDGMLLLLLLLLLLLINILVSMAIIHTYIIYLYL